MLLKITSKRFPCNKLQAGHFVLWSKPAWQWKGWGPKHRGVQRWQEVGWFVIRLVALLELIFLFSAPSSDATPCSSSPSACLSLVWASLGGDALDTSCAWLPEGNGYLEMLVHAIGCNVCQGGPFSEWCHRLYPIGALRCVKILLFLLSKWTN